VAESTGAAVDAALDELYAVDPGSFVEVRTRLAAELRGAGDSAGAKSVLSARRPTTAAWALNQLSREAPALVDAFLERSRELDRAQAGELAGGREAIRTATHEQRTALAEVTDAATAILGERATDAYRAQIQATLRAAGADPAVGDELRSGRFVRELSGPTGFPDVPNLSLVPDLEDRPAPAKRAPVKRAPTARAPAPAMPKPEPEHPGSSEAVGAERAAAAERARAAREREAEEARAARLAEAEEAARLAREELTASEAAAASVHERIDGLKRDLDAARHDARAVDDRVSRATREAARLERAATKLRSR
jgi:hypothetical protein